ncbi:hypothetical protein [Algoriphagus marincola]|uniref:hypothetical protein n=1 Tax=Algoriphagus marincola TaxID=264027 RepID=UPI000427C375|nr:hypothetical protein [Algoriphagus marincola]
MRKIFLPLIAILLAIGCKSKEEKANELINAELFKTLYDYESYQPIETIIDSAFTTIYRDSTILNYAIKASASFKLTNEYLQKTQNAKEIMEIWVTSYSSSYGRRKYQEANEEFNEYLNLAEKTIEITTAYRDSIREAVEFFQSEFIGWEAKHKFRCKTKGGNPDIADYVYIFDPEMKEIIYTEDSNDEDLLQLRENIDELISEDS